MRRVKRCGLGRWRTRRLRPKRSLCQRPTTPSNLCPPTGGTNFRKNLVIIFLTLKKPRLWYVGVHLQIPYLHLFTDGNDTKEQGPGAVAFAEAQWSGPFSRHHRVIENGTIRWFHR